MTENYTRTLGRMAILVYLLLSIATCLAEEPVEGWSGFGGPTADFAMTESRIDFASPPTVLWKVICGDGLSSIASLGDNVFVSSLKAQEKDAKKKPIESVAALRKSDGKLAWKYEWDAGWLEKQEAFGGRARSPQATPLVYQDQVFVVGFTGWLNCLDSQTGELRWKRNLVDDFAATPVQFGFSASPIVVDDQLIVLAGGQGGGLVALDRADGGINWHVPCKEASYATPVVISVGGQKQIVFVTREFVRSVDAGSGEELWQYDLPKSGLTNVPTPLKTGPGRLVISGQGVGGTQELVISRQSDEWIVEEGWASGEQFFYCNWVRFERLIIGCTGNMLVALDATNGNRVARWRGFRDSNIIRLDDDFLIFDGKGKLSLVRGAAAGLQVQSQYQVLGTRCWTPPTVDGQHVFCRGGKELVCLRFGSGVAGSAANRLESLPVRRKELALEKREEERLVMDDGIAPIEQIVERFEEEGAESAWKHYEKIRKQLGEKFSTEERIALAEMAFEQDLEAFAKQILSHTKNDFGGELKVIEAVRSVLAKHVRQPSKKKSVGKNGLVYLELGIQNTTRETIHTVVRGPKQHPFSYGIPFPSGKFRIEKWPVGTKLYESNNEVPGKVLLTVEEKQAGKTMDIP